MQPGRRPLEGARPRLLADPLPAGRRRRRRPLLHDRRRTTASRASLDMTTLLAAVPAGARATASRSRRRCRSATSTASSARSLGSEITRQLRAATGLPDDTIQLHFTGSAGQSFGAFVPRGHDADARRRRQRLRRQGPVGRQASSSTRRRDVDRSSPRRTSSSATSRSTARRAARRSSAAWPASASASATAAPTRSSRASATTAAST